MIVDLLWFEWGHIYFMLIKFLNKRDVMYFNIYQYRAWIFKKLRKHYSRVRTYKIVTLGRAVFDYQLLEINISNFSLKISL